MGDTKISAGTMGAVLALAASAVLVGCAADGPASPSPSATSAQAASTSGTASPPSASPAEEDRVSGLDELYEQVDANLDCPADGGGQHSFMVPGAPSGLPGRQCGTGVVMAWADDPTVMMEAATMLRDSGGPVPMATGPDWFVADVSAVAETGGEKPTMPESTDLEALAKELGGQFSPG